MILTSRSFRYGFSKNIPLYYISRLRQLRPSQAPHDALMATRNKDSVGRLTSAPNGSITSFLTSLEVSLM
jgi:hypothetical protein